MYYYYKIESMLRDLWSNEHVVATSVCNMLVLLMRIRLINGRDWKQIDVIYQNIADRVLIGREIGRAYAT